MSSTSCGSLRRPTALRRSNSRRGPGKCSRRTAATAAATTYDCAYGRTPAEDWALPSKVAANKYAEHNAARRERRRSTRMLTHEACARARRAARVPELHGSRNTTKRKANALRPFALPQVRLRDPPRWRCKSPRGLPAPQTAPRQVNARAPQGHHSMPPTRRQPGAARHRRAIVQCRAVIQGFKSAADSDVTLAWLVLHNMPETWPRGYARLHCLLTVHVIITHLISHVVVHHAAHAVPALPRAAPAGPCSLSRRSNWGTCPRLKARSAPVVLTYTVRFMLVGELDTEAAQRRRNGLSGPGFRPRPKLSANHTH